MPDIMVVQPRKTTTFVLRANIFVVPISDHDLTIRIEGWNHDSDCLIENSRHFVISTGNKVIG